MQEGVNCAHKHVHLFSYTHTHTQNQVHTHYHTHRSHVCMYIKFHSTHASPLLCLFSHVWITASGASTIQWWLSTTHVFLPFFPDCSSVTVLHHSLPAKWPLCSVVHRLLLPTSCRSWLRFASLFPTMWAVSSDRKTTRAWCSSSRTWTCPSQTSGVPASCHHSYNRYKVGEEELIFT